MSISTAISVLAIRRDLGVDLVIGHRDLGVDLGELVADDRCDQRSARRAAARPGEGDLRVRDILGIGIESRLGLGLAVGFRARVRVGFQG